MKKVCKNCSFYAYGMCYFNPPTPVFIGYNPDSPNGGWTSTHPPVEPDDRCAQWKIKSSLKGEEIHKIE